MLKLVEEVTKKSKNRKIVEYFERWLPLYIYFLAKFFRLKRAWAQLLRE